MSTSTAVGSPTTVLTAATAMLATAATTVGSTTAVLGTTAAVSRHGMGAAATTVGCHSVAPTTAVHGPSTTAATESTVGCHSAAAVIASAAFAAEAMPAPAVVITPARPGPHAQEDAVVEIARSVIAHRRAGIRGVIVIAIRAVRLDADNHLSVRSGRK